MYFHISILPLLKMIEEKTQTHHMSDCTVRGLFCMDKITHVTHLSSPQTQTQSLPYKKKKIYVVVTKNPTCNEINLLI